VKREFFQSGALIKQDPWPAISPVKAKTGSKGWFDITGKADLSEFKTGIYDAAHHH
jgi:hypothetical protein